MKHIDSYIIGIHKCATTSLFKVLRQHSNIVTHKTNQLENFFSINSYESEYQKILSEEYSPMKEGGRSLARIMELYADTDSLEKLYRINPNAKLIMVIREPVARALSAFLYSKNNGFIDKDFSLSDLLDNWNQANHKKDSLLINNFIESSMYYSILKNIINVFPVDSIYVLKLEDFSLDSELYAKEIFEFIGVDNQPILPVKDNKVGVMRSLKIHKFMRGESILKTLLRIFISKDVRIKLFHYLVKSNRKEVSYPNFDASDVNKLREIFKDDLNQLSKEFNINY